MDLVEGCGVETAGGANAGTAAEHLRVGFDDGEVGLCEGAAAESEGKDEGLDKVDHFRKSSGRYCITKEV